jgi:hypothetical protein
LGSGSAGPEVAEVREAKKKAAPAPAGSFRQTFSELLKARNPLLLIALIADCRAIDEQLPEEATEIGELDLPPQTQAVREQPSS